MMRHALAGPRHGFRVGGALRQDGGVDVSGVWHAIAICALGYLVGGIPTGWLLVRWQRFGLDVRRYGSGNIGTSNVYRHAGFDIAVIVGPLQFAQGLVPVLLARLLGFSVTVQVLVAVCTVVGNGWPIYLRFNGGRGVAVSTGVLGPVTIAGFIAVLICYGAGALRGRIALGVLVAFLVLPVVALIFNGLTVSLGCVVILLIIAMRRLEGLPDDRRAYGHFWKLAWDRLVFDERPGRPLMGPRMDPGVNSQES
ncbi:MAG: glycerol-3-phosphate acyltransferase [Candidatus Dormibacteria bacterium]